MLTSDQLTILHSIFGEVGTPHNCWWCLQASNHANTFLEKCE